MITSMASHISFNDYIGPEELTREYKEFTFNLTGLSIDAKLAESYCLSNRFDFNKSTIFNLKKYIKQYVPKYTCAFINSNLDGNFYIGINDSGIVKGVPFHGLIPAGYITEVIRKTIRDSVIQCLSSSHTIDFDSLVKISFVKITKPPAPKTKHNMAFIKYMIEKIVWQKEHTKFVEKMDNWRVRYLYFSQKLVDLANNFDSRQMLIQFIKSCDSSSPIISLLQTDFQLGYLDHDEILRVKDDPLNTYYWVTKWKDYMISKLKKEKPVFNTNITIHANPQNILSNCSDMIPYWTNYNSNMNLYVIHIKFMSSNLPFRMDKDTGNYLMYIEKGRFTSCYRKLLSDGEPVCEPYY